ncbi:hypothetical protein O1L55_27710 [Streptomyces albulus]|nr:hypothetical protein [Streptomyces noursei]
MAAIGASPDPPTFENTVVALERSGAVLRRVSAVFFNKANADADRATQELEAEIVPRLAAHEDALLLDPASSPVWRRSTTAGTGSGWTRSRRAC